MAPPFLTSAQDGSGQLHSPTVLLPEKQVSHPSYGKLDGRQSRSGRNGTRYYVVVGLHINGSGPRVSDCAYAVVARNCQ